MPCTSKFEVAGDAGHAKGSGFQQIEEDKLLKPIRADCGAPLGKLWRYAWPILIRTLV
jgi:hypothetical protein